VPRGTEIHRIEPKPVGRGERVQIDDPFCHAARAALPGIGARCASG
jgi:hypothetical protein